MMSLGDMEDFNIRTKYDNIEDEFKCATSNCFPDTEYYRERVQQFSNVLLRDDLKQSLSELHNVGSPKDLVDDTMVPIL